MSYLSLAARNMLVQSAEMAALVTAGKVGSDSVWTDGWVFDNTIIPRLLDDKSGEACVVVSDLTDLDPNDHNTQQFPVLSVDIWAAPTRDSTGSVELYSADLLIEDVFSAIRPLLHVMQPTDSSGDFLWWGTATEISAKTGVPIFNSKHTLTGPFQDVVGGNSVRFRSHIISVSTR